MGLREGGHISSDYIGQKNKLSIVPVVPGNGGDGSGVGVFFFRKYLFFLYVVIFSTVLMLLQKLRGFFKAISFDFIQHCRTKNIVFLSFFGGRGPNNRLFYGRALLQKVSESRESSHFRFSFSKFFV